MVSYSHTGSGHTQGPRIQFGGFELTMLIPFISSMNITKYSDCSERNYEV